MDAGLAVFGRLNGKPVVNAKRNDDLTTFTLTLMDVGERTTHREIVHVDTFRNVMLLGGVPEVSVTLAIHHLPLFTKPSLLHTPNLDGH